MNGKGDRYRPVNKTIYDTNYTNIFIKKEEKMAYFPGRGRNDGDKPGSGPDGNCICPNCGYKIKHEVAHPCNKITCIKCGARMTKE